MNYQAILFDLDGTLLPMDNDRFTKGYFHLLSQTVAPLGYDRASFLGAMMKGVGAMARNDGGCTTCDAFWKTFAGLLGQQVYDLIPVFDEFYRTTFHQVRDFTEPNPLAKEAVETARKKADKVVLATNPLFPVSAVQSRLEWIGLSLEDFDFSTDYESAGFCKPNPAYFSEITHKLGLSPEKCLMVGNSAEEDAVAAMAAGLNAYLVTDCLVAEGALPDCPIGSFRELIDYLKE